jgi:murein L,D-transpeptidase YafK
MSSKRVLILVGVVLAGSLMSCDRSGEGPPAGESADRIVVIKGERRLYLMEEEKVIKVYRIALGKSPIGQKLCEGDNKTPEGSYAVDWKTEKSMYHKALHISYPSRTDTAAARKRGCSPGGDIMVHGLPKNFGWLGGLHRLVDWTRGCIAVTNAEIEEIYRIVPVGTRIEIRP